MAQDVAHLEALTDLLHRAYAALAAMGFRYRATYQDVATTRARAGKGECYLALQNDVDPGPIDAIFELKSRMAKQG